MLFLLLYPCEDNLVNVDGHKPLIRIKQVKASKLHFCIKCLSMVVGQYARANLVYTGKQNFFLYIKSHIFAFIFNKASPKLFSNDCTKTNDSLKGWG